jgi:putative transposase
VAKHGTRYEAIQAVGMAVRQQFGHLDAGTARGLALRHDHGSNFMAEVFQKQIKFWGMSPSYAFVGEPETNGVIERLFRTLKEQIVHGRIFQTIDEVRDAVRAFVARYNAEWLIEKNGHAAPMLCAPPGTTRPCGAPHKTTTCPGNRVRYICGPAPVTRFPGPAPGACGA